MIDTFLAALKELARAGARYVEEEIRTLRESFRTSLNEARDAWRAIQVRLRMQLKVKQHFFVNRKLINVCVNIKIIPFTIY